MLFNSKNILGIPTSLTLGGSPSYVEPSILSEAYAVYSTKDVYGNGGNVIQLYHQSSSPTSRDFTATELTDGTYASWAVGTPSVAKLYDQKGSADMANGFGGTQPLYDSSDNSFRSDKGGYFGNYRYLVSSSSQGIEDNFGDNNINESVTFAMNVKSNSGASGSDVQPIFGTIDNAPTQAVNQRSKAISLDQSDDKVGARMKDQTYSLFNAKTDTALTTSYKNYTITMSGGFGAVFSTNFEVYGNTTLEKSNSTDSLDSGTLRVRSFVFGNAPITSNILIGIPRRLTSDEVSKLNTEMNAL